jgi:hypothetical protein
MLNRKFYLFFSLFFLFIFGMLNAPMIAHAADYFVDKTNGDDLYDGLDWSTAKETIGTAILIADPGDGPDTIHVAAETYPEKIIFRNNLTLWGGYPSGGGERNPEANETIIDGNNSGSVVTFDSVENCTIDGFTIQNGSGSELAPNRKVGGGIYCLNSLCTISHNIIISNDVKTENWGEGGGICCMYSSPVILENIIQENNAYFGGGVYCYSSYPGFSPNISFNTIDYNQALHGGGIYISGDATSVIVIIDNNKIRNNMISSVGAGGAGIKIHSGNSSITNNIIEKNGSDGLASRGGGIAFVYESVPAGSSEVRKNIILENYTTHNGGGIEIIGYGNITIDSNIIGNNSAQYGAGIRIESNGIVKVQNNLISNNYGIIGLTTYGGGIRITESEPLILNNTIVNNIDGGGISFGGISSIIDVSFHPTRKTVAVFFITIPR